MSEATNPEAIDGDKVVEFIRGVQNLGKILETINVIQIKDAFLIGSKHKAIEDIIRTEQKWFETFKAMGEQMEETADHHRKIMLEHQNMIAFIKHHNSIINGPESARAITMATKLSEVLDRLDKHRASGLLEAVVKI